MPDAPLTKSRDTHAAVSAAASTRVVTLLLSFSGYYFHFRSASLRSFSIFVNYSLSLANCRLQLHLGLPAASQHMGYTRDTATGCQLSSISISFTYCLFLSMLGQRRSYSTRVLNYPIRFSTEYLGSKLLDSATLAVVEAGRLVLVFVS